MTGTNPVLVPLASYSTYRHYWAINSFAPSSHCRALLAQLPTKLCKTKNKFCWIISAEGMIKPLPRYELMV